MNSTTILQSDFLDIIFENRNKEYGAYRLRKFYENRLSVAILIMVGIVILFSFFQFFWNTYAPDNKPSEFKTNDYKPTKYEAKIECYFNSDEAKYNKGSEKKCSGNNATDC